MHDRDVGSRREVAESRMEDASSPYFSGGLAGLDRHPPVGHPPGGLAPNSARGCHSVAISTCNCNPCSTHLMRTHPTRAPMACMNKCPCHSIVRHSQYCSCCAVPIELVLSNGLTPPEMSSGDPSMWRRAPPDPSDGQTGRLERYNSTMFNLVSESRVVMCDLLASYRLYLYK